MANPVVLGSMQLPGKLRTLAQCLMASVALSLLTWAGYVLQINLLTISFLYLLIVGRSVALRLLDGVVYVASGGTFA